MKSPYRKWLEFSVNDSALKFGLPKIRAMIGVIRSRTSAVMTAPKATPITTATARSTTLPRSRNVLKSRSMRRASPGAANLLCGSLRDGGCGYRLAPSTQRRRKEWFTMADSVYRVTEVIGVSSESWEAAARHAVETAGKTVRDLRVAEVVRQDVTIENGGVVSFRVRLGISFKYDSGE